MTYFMLEHPETRERVIVPDTEGRPGWVVLAEIPRLPDEFERWDIATGAFVIDRDARSDTRAGREHIATLRALKMAEAAMILAGVVPTQGMLIEEAAQRGVSVQALAQAVMGRAAALRARELQRIAEKTAI